jgi:hypothetical protein
MRTMTIKEYVLEELNKMLAAEGRDVRIVSERPKPTLVTDNVVRLEPKHDQQNSQ